LPENSLQVREVLRLANTAPPTVLRVVFFFFLAPVASFFFLTLTSLHLCFRNDFPDTPFARLLYSCPFFSCIHRAITRNLWILFFRFFTSLPVSPPFQSPFPCPLLPPIPLSIFPLYLCRPVSGVDSLFTHHLTTKSDFPLPSISRLAT